MKISHSTDGPGTTVQIRGDLEAANCACLRAYWRRHLDHPGGTLVIEMEDADAIDSPNVAALTGIIRRHLDRGTNVRVRHAPQMLAHTLYKVGLLSRPNLVLFTPRGDEQPFTG